MFSKYSIAVSAVVLGIAIVISAAFLADLKIRVKSEDNRINVQGQAGTVMSADYATFSYTITQTRETAAEAYTALMVAQTQARSRLLNLGFKDEDFQLGTVNVSTEMKRNPNGTYSDEILKVNASVTTRVVSRDLALVAAQYRQPESLMARGVLVDTTAPVYRLDDLRASAAGLVGPATADAVQKAHAIADQSAGKLGGMLYANPDFSCEPVPGKPGKLAVTVTVFANFQVE